MKLLLDTHFVIWLASEPDEITMAERRLLTGVEVELFVSAISIWELRVKQAAERRRGRPPSVLPPDQAMRFCAANGLVLLPLTGDDCATWLDQPTEHDDPFDDILLVHAQRHDLRLLTRDHAMLAHPLAYPA